MSDNGNVIQFPDQNNSKSPYRNVSLGLIGAAQVALDKRMTEENRNSADVINRALQMYDCIQQMIAGLDRYDKIKSELVVDDTVRLSFTIRKVSE